MSGPKRGIYAYVEASVLLPMNCVTRRHLQAGGRTRPLAAIAIALFWVWSLASVSAQETRADELAQQRAEKAETLRPDEPNTAERLLDAMKNFPMLSDSPHGFYPLFGGIIDGAGWLKGGVAHRRNFGEAGQHITTHVRVSNTGYWQVGGEVQMPNVVPGRLAMQIDGSHLHARDVKYYGLGNGSVDSDDPAVFAMDATTAGFSGTVRTFDHLSVGGRASYEHVSTGPATLVDPGEHPSVNIEEAPGFGHPLDYLHGEVFIDLDWRESPGYTRSGGRTRLGVHRYTQVNGSESSFTRIDAEVAQHFPFLHGARVIALRGLVSLTSVADGREVPHSLLPSIGGRSSVRSLPSFRFQDRHRLLLNAEYRWRASELVDMAIFGDAGKVAATRHDLDLSDLHTAIGFGVRLHGPAFTAIRLALAHGTEGTRALFAIGPIF